MRAARLPEAALGRRMITVWSFDESLARGNFARGVN